MQSRKPTVLPICGIITPLLNLNMCANSTALLAADVDAILVLCFTSAVRSECYVCVCAEQLPSDFTDLAKFLEVPSGAKAISLRGHGRREGGASLLEALGKNRDFTQMAAAPASSDGGAIEIDAQAFWSRLNVRWKHS